MESKLNCRQASIIISVNLGGRLGDGAHSLTPPPPPLCLGMDLSPCSQYNMDIHVAYINLPWCNSLLCTRCYLKCPPLVKRH